MEHLGRYEVTIAIFREDDQWVSRCEELNVSSCGATVDEAYANIKDALEVYLDTLDANGEIERLLAMKELHPHTAPTAKLEQNVYRTSLAIPTTA